ncbi:hypothetical protein M409DRAFT_27996 [Zasmidium cellare ATCC 36951]|uniref:Uncharacterized protein n=1 Tax=Zasmidium cellare ATCC 36951 TaxID=1080233 RepID=A0A6A6C3J1_ZASCE|nr:uncharacterized protein M409DRAFT_27996 [Zasmidium cellare ATCC 36951]KAF2161601.1 hypothetical protein M409DRAFT_27996 [Zasmidium cellare ATCC 36951]
MADDTDAEADAPCRLWKLPGELRNRIYRYVLIQQEDATGDSMVNVEANGYDRPGLLSTCKEIRREALKIYYYENTFHVQIKNFNSAPLVEWKNHYMAKPGGRTCYCGFGGTTENK